MTKSHTELYFHIIFSTKYRVHLIKKKYDPKIHSILKEIANGLECSFIACGNSDDHVHLLIRLKAAHTLSKIVQNLKGSSSKQLNDKFFLDRNFAWQTGYAAFSVSRSDIPRVVAYLKKQREHHKHQAYADEYQKITHSKNF